MKGTREMRLFDETSRLTMDITVTMETSMSIPTTTYTE